MVPARVARVQDEPALARRDEARVGLLEWRLGNHLRHPAAHAADAAERSERLQREVIISTAMSADGATEVGDWFVQGGGDDAAGRDYLRQADAMLLGTDHPSEGLAWTSTGRGPT